jgi:hypothetical protein
MTVRKELLASELRRLGFPRAGRGPAAAAGSSQQQQQQPQNPQHPQAGGSDPHGD